MLAFCILLLGQLAFWLWSEWITRDLVEVALDLDSPTIIDREIHIPLREAYELSFVFARHPGKGEDTRAFVDGAGYFEGRWSADGARIPIAWSLTDMENGQTVASATTVTSGASSWSDTDVSRHVDDVRAPPARYRFRARIPHPVPALSNAQPRLRLALPGGKGAATWQIGLVFWGSLASVLLVLPLMTVLAAVMLRRARSGRAAGAKARRKTA